MAWEKRIDVSELRKQEQEIRGWITLGAHKMNMAGEVSRDTVSATARAAVAKAAGEGDGAGIDSAIGLAHEHGQDAGQSC